VVCCSAFSCVSHLTACYHREPGPHSYFKRIQPGDVGYIREGCFHLLFSAGCPLGGRELGVHVPLSFKELKVGQIFNRQPREPGYIATKSVRTSRARPTRRRPPSPTSAVPYVYSTTSIPPVPQTWAPGRLSLAAVSRSSSREDKAPPF